MFDFHMNVCYLQFWINVWQLIFFITYQRKTAVQHFIPLHVLFSQSRIHPSLTDKLKNLSLKNFFDCVYSKCWIPYWSWCLPVYPMFTIKVISCLLPFANIHFVYILLHHSTKAVTINFYVNIQMFNIVLSITFRNSSV